MPAEPRRSTHAPRILIVYAHARPYASRVNQMLIEVASALPNVTVRDLYETYPDFHIDVAAEQALLEAADLVVFQHPVQWYSMPALQKEWLDLVLEAGWAYGEGGNALRGKGFWLVLSTGSSVQAYQPDGTHQHEFSAFLPPFQQTAHLCGMRWWPPLVLHGAHRVTQAHVAAHAEQYRQLLAAYPDWDLRGFGEAVLPSVVQLPAETLSPVARAPVAESLSADGK